MLNEFTYGDNNIRAIQLKKDIKPGDYIFFHKNIRGIKYITAYYVVEMIRDTSEVVKDKKLIAKYKNPHIKEYIANGKPDDDDVMVFGNPITSRVLERPLPFNAKLAKGLSLNIQFNKDKTELQNIGSATRAFRKLTDMDVNTIMKSIEVYEKEGIKSDAILSSDEVIELQEKDIENFIEANPIILGKDLTYKRRQFDTPVGRIDMIFEDKLENSVIIELKLHKIGRDAITQLRGYMNWMKKQTNKKVTGIIVCKGVLPTFEDEFKTLKNIKIFYYGWNMIIREEK